MSLELLCRPRIKVSGVSVAFLSVRSITLYKRTSLFINLKETLCCRICAKVDPSAALFVYTDFVLLVVFLMLISYREHWFDSYGSFSQSLFPFCCCWAALHFFLFIPNACLFTTVSVVLFFFFSLVTILWLERFDSLILIRLERYWIANSSGLSWWLESTHKT